MTSKPDLYPLVISYGAENGKIGDNYLMVQYFRNYIVRPALGKFFIFKGILLKLFLEKVLAGVPTMPKKSEHEMNYIFRIAFGRKHSRLY